jgi:hypothetical protein
MRSHVKCSGRRRRWIALAALASWGAILAVGCGPTTPKALPPAKNLESQIPESAFMKPRADGKKGLEPVDIRERRRLLREAARKEAQD